LRKEEDRRAAANSQGRMKTAELLELFEGDFPVLGLR
jgi:hypothetical protein